MFLKIEMGNHFNNFFISSCYNSYFLKFLNENALEIHQYLLCPTWNKANNKEFPVFVYLKTTQYLWSPLKNSNINNIYIFSNEEIIII